MPQVAVGKVTVRESCLLERCKHLVVVGTLAVLGNKGSRVRANALRGRASDLAPADAVAQSAKG